MDLSPGDHDALPIERFDYELPPELIAQHPLEDRAASRMLVLRRDTGEIEHSEFRRVSEWLEPGDLLVINDTRVRRARLIAKRATGGTVEFLLLEPLADGSWRSMARPSRRLRSGERLVLFDTSNEPTTSRITVLEKAEDGTVTVDIPDFDEVEHMIGRVPLPHYITEHLDDAERYQTVYATQAGSAAAPTAGLHFTDEVFDMLRTRGVEIARVTLHVGPGTFQPIKVPDARDHRMHAERYRVDADTLKQIRSARRDGRRVVAVGTTSCRTLESIVGQLDSEQPVSGSTNLFITPGYRFQVVGGLLTNFHLPRSTLLLLVSAFAGREPVLRSYAEAIERRYRFYSFGDAMLIL